MVAAMIIVTGRITMIKQSVCDAALDVRRWCELSFNELRAMGEYTAQVGGGGYTLIKANAPYRLPILGVAHIDSFGLKQGGGKIHDTLVCQLDADVRGMSLDDRLGVWALLRGLPSQLCVRGGGVPYDVLLTENEEAGASTADDFYKARGLAGYGWAFMFDRMGSDCVRYSFDDPAWVAALRGEGWSVGTGSYSCVSEFSAGPVCAVNFGIGYTGQHTSACHVDMRVALWNIQRVAHFVRRYGRTEFAHVDDGGGRNWDYGRWDWSDYGPARARVTGENKQRADVVLPVVVPSVGGVGHWAQVEPGAGDDTAWEREFARHCDNEAALNGDDGWLYDDSKGDFAGVSRRKRGRGGR